MIKVDGCKHPVPHFSSKHTTSHQVLRRFLLLVTESPYIIILQSATLPSHRYPKSIMQQQPKKNLNLGRAQAFHSSFAPLRDVIPRNKALYAEEAEYVPSAV